MRRVVQVCLFTLFLTACAVHPMRPAVQLKPDPHVLVKPYVPELNESGLFHLSCTDRYPAGHSVYAALDSDTGSMGRVALARKHFIHAAMASNVYLDPASKPQYALPGWTLFDALTSDTGLALHVYGDGPTLEGSGQIVVAYRGTDSPIDWRNNLALREPPQYRQALAHLRPLRAKYPQAAMTVAGHSLGGGIAMNMSMRVPGVEAVGFNMSPRVRFGRTTPYDTYRASLYEVGEFLTGVTRFPAAVALPDSVHYGNYNFLDYRFFAFSPVPEHSIYEFTRALTVLAMTRGDAKAREFFKVNIGEEQARRVDWDNCRAIFHDGDGDA